MAKSVIIFASALCFLSLLGFAYCETPRLFVEGKVYCDTCRTQFVTRVTEYMKGAKVRLECRDNEGGSVTYSAEAETDASGTYRIPVDGDHEEEICEIQLVKSSSPDCSEVSNDPYNKLSARVSITSNNGIASPVRQANPLGFLKKEPLPECSEVLRELGITAEGLV
ncbi:Pollen allergen Ole e 1 family [Parasponia andersonii]|uniref:Pollen allergen Ole e 1 family n=1 Tax=Parasponia andersonii TaxID=3476 RepID=A0A2P5AXY6_PARAD|nr:Pollen allergen Ole e 1 family [Parasponia andersonii]